MNSPHSVIILICSHVTINDGPNLDLGANGCFGFNTYAEGATTVGESKYVANEGVRAKLLSLNRSHLLELI